MRLPTDIPSLTVRTLALADAQDFFDGIDKNREVLGVFEHELLDMYPDVGAVVRQLSGSNVIPQCDYGMFVDDQFAGGINLKDRHEDCLVGEVSYWLQERFTGNGYAAVALRALTKCLSYRYYWYVADVVPGNIASSKTLLAAGFTYEKFIKNKYLHYALCADDISL